MDFNITSKETEGLLALLVKTSICFPHLRSSDIVNPRYLAADTLSSSILSRKYLEGWQS